MLFAILQKYDFSSKSQQNQAARGCNGCCLRYCKSTIFQANHNAKITASPTLSVVCDTAKVRFFKQITTGKEKVRLPIGCLRYCKSTIFQANHNYACDTSSKNAVVCDTAKVRFFKQITTRTVLLNLRRRLFAILQKYDFSSKSQPNAHSSMRLFGCLRYCKSTIFQANHNLQRHPHPKAVVVCDTAKVRFFKQITTAPRQHLVPFVLFAILQKYDFSSKSQPAMRNGTLTPSCLRYCKSTIFQANHNSKTHPCFSW